MRKLFNFGAMANRLSGLMVVLTLCSSAVSAQGDDSTSKKSLADQVVAQARQMESVQIDDAIQMMLSREQEVLQGSNAREKARFYNKLAELNSTRGHLVDQQKYAEKGLALLGNETVPVGADLNYNLGLVYEMKTDYITARLYYDKGLTIAQTTGSQLFEGRGKLYIAAIYTAQNDYSQALSLMQEAYALAQKVNDPDLSWEVLNEMGLLYSYTGDDEQAVEFQLLALSAARTLKMKELIIVSLYNVGSLYIRLKAYDKANLHFEEMLIQSKESTEKSNMYIAYKGYALSVMEAGNDERALSYMNKAQEYLPYVQEVILQFEHYVVKADLLNKLDFTNKAVEELSIAEQILPKDLLNNENNSGLIILGRKSKFYAELGQYQYAFEMLTSYMEGYKKLRSKEKEEKVLKNRVNFDVQRNEIRNQMLEKDNKIKALQLKQATSEQQIQTFFLIALALLSLGLIVGMYRQIHARRELKSIAETDGLTELFNRRYAFASGENLAKTCKESDSPLSVILFDLDEFKDINDTYGHPAGDFVLKNIGEISKACLRGSDIMARVGGEEFLAILPGVKLEMAEFIAGRLKEKMEHFEQAFEDNSFYVTASFGVAVANEDDDFEKLIQRADKALYQAKDNGRNCVALASEMPASNIKH
jgi:diguanylate cyclase (GGDEF)-like protein